MPEHENKPRVIVPGVVPECVEEFAPWADALGADEDPCEDIFLDRSSLEEWAEELGLNWVRNEAPQDSELLELVDIAIAGGVVRFYIDTHMRTFGATCFGVYGDDLLAFACDETPPETADQLLALLKQMAERLEAYKWANPTLTEVELQQQMNGGAGS